MGRACPSEFFSSLGKKSPTNRREIFPNCHGQENFSQQSLVLDSTGNLPPAVMDSAGNFFLSSQGQYRKSFPSSLGQYRKSFPSSHGQYRKSFPRQSWTVQEIFPQHAVPNSTGKFFSRISSSSGKFLIIS